MGCGTNFAKILLIIFNIIFWLSGAALLGVGIWLLVDDTVIQYVAIFEALEASGELLKYASYVLIAVGSFVLIVGFFGCCGAIKENRCMLGVYIVLLVLIMGLEIAAGVLAIVYKEKVLLKVNEKLKSAFDEYYTNTTEKGKAFSTAVNFAQSRLKCCGIDGPKDYTSKVYPLTCCTLKAGGLDKAIESLTTTDVENYATCQLQLADTANKNGTLSYKDGCVEKLKDWIISHSIILIGVGIGVACLELFGFIFAVCLCRSIGDEE